MLFALAILFLLSACSEARFDTKQSTALILPATPPVDEQTSSQAVEEIESGSCPALTELAKDYLQTRDRLRIAKEGLK